MVSGGFRWFPSFLILKISIYHRKLVFMYRPTPFVPIRPHKNDPNYVKILFKKYFFDIITCKYHWKHWFPMVFIGFNTQDIYMSNFLILRILYSLPRWSPTWVWSPSSVTRGGSKDGNGSHSDFSFNPSMIRQRGSAFST